MIQIITGLIILGILVFVHEAGHFIAAKAFGIRVLAFSLGFGRPLINKTINGTDYRISIFPFGGYVHLSGEYPSDVQSGAADEFYSQKIWKRCVVSLAGPIANFLFALVVLWIMFLYGEKSQRYMERPIVGEVIDSSSAWTAGFQIGDSIVSINSKQVRSWHDIKKIFKNTELSSEPYGGLLPAIPAIIDSIFPGFPASTSGLQKGDIVTDVDDSTVRSWAHFSRLIASFDSTRKHLILTVRRDTELVKIKITPVLSTQRQRYVIGVTAAEDDFVRIKYTPARAFIETIKKSGEYTTMIFVHLKRMLSRPKTLKFEIEFFRNSQKLTRPIEIVPKKISPKDLSGPVGIVQISGSMVMLGIAPLLSIIALISVNLAVINLMPFFIITDGGQIFFFLIEALRKKRLSLRTMTLIQRIAIAALVALALYITYNDIIRIPLYFKIFQR